MAGIDVTEQDVVSFASSNTSEKTGRPLCTIGYGPEDNGGTTEEGRREILAHFGIDSVCVPADIDGIARNVEQGRGVIISVLCEKFYPSGCETGLHAVTVTSVKRDKNGDVAGFFICDSNGYPAKYYDKYSLAESLSGRKMNVTTDIIR